MNVLRMLERCRLERRWVRDSEDSTRAESTRDAPNGPRGIERSKRRETGGNAIACRGSWTVASSRRVLRPRQSGSWTGRRSSRRVSSTPTLLPIGRAPSSALPGDCVRADELVRDRGCSFRTVFPQTSDEPRSVVQIIRSSSMGGARTVRLERRPRIPFTPCAEPSAAMGLEPQRLRLRPRAG
jgi:hypothetical protein